MPVNPYDQGLRTITERTVSLRVRGEAADELVELPLDAALRDVYPGAIYHQQGQNYEVQSLDLPETTLSTRALYVTLPPGLERLTQTMSGSFEGGLHAVQHALVATFPLVILCDRRDVGSVSTTDHPQAETSALFIYDNYRGGVGLARNRYDHIEDLFQHTWELLADYGCSDVCPACIQSPHCGRANEPLDKRLAATLTMALADPNRQADDGTPKSDSAPASNGNT